MDGTKSNNRCVIDNQELTMFQMFGFGGTPCPRCDQRNSGASGYCAHCGLTLGAPRNVPVLRENRWIAGTDDLAVFFGVKALSGLFVKTLRVPATTRAYILQGDKATEVPQGEYEIEGLFTRLNNLLRDQHAEILITRTSALPVQFHFDDLATSEQLLVSAQLSVSLRIEHVPAFARHFMTMPGVVSSAQLRELLSPSVRQLAAEFVAGQSIRDMAGNRELRAQLDERLQGALRQRLAQYGLAVVEVDTLSLRHDKYDANRARVGSLFLVADEGHVKLEHEKQLDQLYDDAEWQRIYREEQQARLRIKRSGQRQDEAIERAELSLANSERMQGVRAREIDLYSRIVDARNRKQAIEQGAGEVLAELEHEMAKKGALREDESVQWGHVRALAQIRMRTELEIAQQEQHEARLLAQQRFSHQLLQQQIENKITQALAIEDEERKRDELVRLHAARTAAAKHQANMDAEHHKAQWQSLALANAAKKRELERVAEWEEQLALDRQRELMRADARKDAGAKEELEAVGQRIDALTRDGAQQEALAQHEKLLRTITADGKHVRQEQEIALEAEAQRLALHQKVQEAVWQQELRRLEHERAEAFARETHAADLARIDIARMESIGAMSDTAKIALAPTANAAILADYLKTQVHAGMRADQLGALASVVGATNSVTPAELARLSQEHTQQERERRDAEVDKDRRHQLDLLLLQNDVNKAALATQSQLGVGVAQAQSQALRGCQNGHTVHPGDKFCAQCGVALQH
jgi:hypothetical protein